MRYLSGLAALSVLAVVGRADAVIVGEPPDSPAAHVDPNVTTSPYGGVVGINVTGIGPASGVLLRTTDTAHSYVLTAAHIIDPNRNGTYSPASDISVHVNYSGDSSSVLGVSAVHVHPEWPGGFNDDLVVLQLNGAVPAGVPTYNLYRVPSIIGGPAPTITIVGYGQSGTGSTGATIGNGVNVKRVGQNVADAIGLDDEGKPVYEVYQFDFDNPAGGNGPLGGPTLGNAIEVQFGIGDSGGPAFVTGPGGELLIYGINTAGFHGDTTFPLYGSAGGGQLVSAYQTFIDQYSVPEPGSLALIGVATLGLLRRRPRQ